MKVQRARTTLVVIRELILLDLRHLRRHALNPVLLAILAATLIGSLLILGGFHLFVSGDSPFHGISNPKYGLGSYEPTLFYLCVLTIVLLCLRLPSYREDFIENVIITYRSPSNFLLALSRVLAPTLLVVTVLLVVALTYQTVAAVSVFIQPHILEPLEPWSLTFVLANLLVATFFWTSLGSLISEIFKSRTIGFIGAAVILLVQSFVSPLLPSNLGSFTFGYAASDLYVSDLSPNYWEVTHFFYWLSVVCLSFAAIYATSLFNSRTDTAKRSVYKHCIVVLTLGCIGLQALVHVHIFQAMSNYLSWPQAYEKAAQTIRGLPTVIAIEGFVRIEPGVELQLALSYTIDAPEVPHYLQPEDSSPSIALALNPGMNVSDVTCSDTEVSYSHRQGILEIDLQDCDSSDTSEYMIDIGANGYPDPYYLAIPKKSIDDVDVRQRTLQMLGQKTSIFTKQYVALTPSSHWYPQALIANIPSPSSDARDLIDVSLKLDLEAKSWSVVSLGGQVLTPQDFQDSRNVLRGKFRTIGLLASEFDVNTQSFDEIDINMLVHQRHANRLNENELRKNSLVRFVREAIVKIESHGIDYPFNQFSIVEVPSQLSTLNYKRGTNIGLDSVLMFREAGLPFARASFWEKVSEQADAEGKAWYQEAVDWTMITYWTNPVFGQTYEDVIVDGILADRVYAPNEHSMLTNAILQILLKSLIETDNYRFDFDIANELAAESRVNVRYLLFRLRNYSPLDLKEFRQNLLDSNSFWESIEGSFAEEKKNNTLDPTRASFEQRRWVRVRLAKFAELISASYDQEKIANTLANTLAASKSEPIELSDVVEKAQAVGMDIAPLIVDTLFLDKLPGIHFSGARQAKIPSDEDTSPRFVTVIDFHNGEDVPAYVEFEIAEYSTMEIDGTNSEVVSRVDTFGPFKLEGKSSYQLLMKTKDQIGDVEANTFLSLNRGLIEIPITNVPSISVDYSALEIETDWISITPTEWIPFEDENVVIVDDLDPGFIVKNGISTPKRPWWNLEAGWFRSYHPTTNELDNGLPSVTYPATHRGIWARSNWGACWGRYRHTYAFAPFSTHPIQEVSFNAELSQTGRWELSYHFPNRFWGGDYAIEVRTGPQRWDVTLESDDQHDGWNTVGTFNIKVPSEVQVSVSNSSSAPYVVADAIKWKYLE